MERDLTVEEEVAAKLEDFVKDYDLLVKDYNHFLTVASGSKSPYLEWETKFNNLHHKLTKIIPFIFRYKIKHDDRELSALRARITISTFGVGPDLEKSWQRADTKASASEEYAKALEARAFWEESYLSMRKIEDNISNFLTEITHKIKTYERSQIIDG